MTEIVILGDWLAGPAIGTFVAEGMVVTKAFGASGAVVKTFYNPFRMDLSARLTQVPLAILESCWTGEEANTWLERYALEHPEAEVEARRRYNTLLGGQPCLTIDAPKL